jgi:hypothetical protein
MDTVKQISTVGEFLLWSRLKKNQQSHVLYNSDGQIVCDFGSERPCRAELGTVVKAWRASAFNQVGPCEV